MLFNLVLARLVTIWRVKGIIIFSAIINMHNNGEVIFVGHPKTV